MTTRKIAVVGVGAMGSMALWQLARRGHEVVGFDRMGVPHDTSAHGAESRIFRLAYREGKEYIPLLKRSLELWRELQASSDRRFHYPIGCLYIGERDADWLTGTIEGAREHDVRHEVLDEPALRRRFPQHRLSGGEFALFDLDGGLLRPELGVRAAVKAAQAAGAMLHQGCAVERIAPDADGVEITAAGNTRRFDAAVVTCGAWGARAIDVPSPHFIARRLVGTWFGVDNVEAYLPERFPVCIRHTSEIDYSGFPSMDGWSIKIMPPVNFRSDIDPSQVDRTVSYEDTAIMRRVARTLLEGVDPEPVRSGVYLDGFTSDNHPIIDYHPASERVVLAAGFSGHGYKMSPAVGVAVADLIDSGGDNYIRHHFSAHRPTLQAA
ncbi:MAG: N-methyl-L-tryptophan oxidase [Parvibaculaceae bacterium]